MDFHHLRAFIAVAEESSITRAAERLHISQPPLSRHIQQLESEIGVSLFLRHRHGVTLTGAGRRLLDKARSMDRAASEFLETASQLRNAQAIRIGIGWGLWEAVCQVRVAAEAHVTGITIEACDAFRVEEYNEQLRNGSLDVVFARGQFDTTALNVAPMFDERLVVVLSADHPLASRKSVHIRDLAEDPLLLWDRHAMPVLYDKALEVYSRAHIVPRTIPTPGAGPWNHNGMMLIASGKGVYVCIGVRLTSPHPATGVAVVPIADADATIEVGFAWRKNETSTTVLQFIDCARQVFPGRSVPSLARTSRRAS